MLFQLDLGYSLLVYSVEMVSIDSVARRLKSNFSFDFFLRLLNDAMCILLHTHMLIYMYIQ